MRGVSNNLYSIREKRSSLFNMFPIIVQMNFRFSENVHMLNKFCILMNKKIDIVIYHSAFASYKKDLEIKLVYGKRITIW